MSRNTTRRDTTVSCSSSSTKKTQPKTPWLQQPQPSLCWAICSLLLVRQKQEGASPPLRKDKNFFPVRNFLCPLTSAGESAVLSSKTADKAPKKNTQRLFRDIHIHRPHRELGRPSRRAGAQAWTTQEKLGCTGRTSAKVKTKKSAGERKKNPKSSRKRDPSADTWKTGTNRLL